MQAFPCIKRTKTSRIAEMSNRRVFRQLQQFEGIARYLGEIVHSASRGAVGGVGGLPHQYSRGDLFKVERLKDSFFILPNDGYSDFFSKEEVGFMQRFVYNRSMKLPPTRT
mgnify:CR=1 FL=1